MTSVDRRYFRRFLGSDLKSRPLVPNVVCGPSGELLVGRAVLASNHFNGRWESVSWPEDSCLGSCVVRAAVAQPERVPPNLSDSDPDGGGLDLASKHDPVPSRFARIPGEDVISWSNVSCLSKLS